MNDIAIVIVIALVMAVGLVGTALPVVPGLGLIWLGGLAYALFTGFDVVAITFFSVMSGVAVAGALAGIAVPRRRAAASGAAPASLWLGGLLGVVGFFVVPVIGLPVGGVLGVFVGEQLRTRNRHLAWHRTRATLVGFGLAALLQLGAGTVMILCWIAWVLAE